MGTVLGTLGELGYGWAYRVLDAQFFGVAQRRRRVFIVGCLGDAAGAAQVLFEPESCSGYSSPRREARAGVAGSVAACLNSGGNNGGSRTEPGEHLVAACVTSKWAKGTGGPAGNECQNLVAATLNAHSPRYDHWTEDFIVAHAPTAEDHDASEGGMRRGSPTAAVRRLTPKECERLQGFPDGWTAVVEQSDSARYRQLGNAVCVPVAEWIGHRIMEIA